MSLIARPRTVSSCLARERKSDESKSQAEFVQWLRATYPDVLFCASVGGYYMTKALGARAKREGYCPGVPDLLVYERAGDYVGLALEFKTATGRVSDVQVAWLVGLERRGWKTAVPRSVEDAIRVFCVYIEQQQR